jgi:Plasmid pRiA4b ORF-3-like protein
MDEGPWADDLLIGKLPLQPKDRMTLTYDFGDNWEFVVKLEGIEPPARRKKLPRLLEKHGVAPEQYPEWED